MRYDWSPLQTELRQWRAEARILPLWWRDDDAIEPTSALNQLGDLSVRLGLPVHLAVIPKFATRELAEVCTEATQFVPVVHGWAHENRTIGVGKKAEFGAARADALHELGLALARMEAMFGATLLKMFVPPWNRISPEISNKLSGLGYMSISTYTPRSNRLAAPNLVQINTHIDPIYWRGGGSLADPDALIQGIVQLLKDRRLGHSDGAEPLGFLTHHLVHDPDIWYFSEACLNTLLEGGAEPINLLKLKDKLP